MVDNILLKLKVSEIKANYAHISGIYIEILNILVAKGFSVLYSNQLHTPAVDNILLKLKVSEVKGMIILI